MPLRISPVRGSDTAPPTDQPRSFRFSHCTTLYRASIGSTPSGSSSALKPPRTLNRLRVIVEGDAEVADAGIERPRPVVVVRQRHQAQMLPQRQGMTLRRY